MAINGVVVAIIVWIKFMAFCKYAKYADLYFFKYAKYGNIQSCSYNDCLDGIYGLLIQIGF